MVDHFVKSSLPSLGEVNVHHLQLAVAVELVAVRLLGLFHSWVAGVIENISSHFSPLTIILNTPSSHDIHLLLSVHFFPTRHFTL